MVSIFSKFVFPLLVLFLIAQPFLVHSRTQNEYFKIFQNLRESIQEGQSVTGLSEIKQYLQDFGYYPSDVLDVNDNFDQPLKFALETYQKNYRLNVTGMVDHETVKTMMVPRCGVPDIVNHTTFLKRFGNSLKFYMVSHYKLINGEPKWSKYDLTYRLINTRVVNQQAFSDVMSRAFGRWSAETKFTFQEAPIRTRADIYVSFERGDHGDGDPFDGPPHPGRNTWAHAYPPSIGLLHFDGDDYWSTSNPTRSQIDLESVAVHEIGHILGLDHSMEQTAIMFATINYGDIKRKLTTDDIDGIEDLYK